MVDEAFASGWKMPMLLLTQKFLRQEAAEHFILKASQIKVPVYSVKEKDLRGIVETVQPQGIVALLEPQFAKIEQLSKETRPSLIVALDGVAEPGNLGTIIRTCDWFGIHGIMVGRGSVDVLNSKVVRSSMGSIFHLPIVREVNLVNEISQLKNRGYEICAAVASGGKGLEVLSRNQKLVLMFGNEAHGLDDRLLEMVDDEITIPKFGRAESLNVSAACAVLLSHLRLTARSTDA